MVYLYRHFDRTGKLLYVGISLNHVARLSQHKKAPWVERIARVEIEEHPSRADALDAEKAAIRSEAPEFNKQHKALPKPTVSPREVGIPKDDPRDNCVVIRPFYSVYEAAKALCVSEPTVRKKIAAGELGGVVIRTHTHMGKQVTHWGITGWQMVEYLNALEVNSPQVPA
jgi:excisionase family DNA binding protein